MAYEQRKGGTYYYQKVRKNGHVRSEYVGVAGSPHADIAASIGHLDRTRRRLARLDIEDMYAEFADLDQGLGELAQQLQALVAAELEAAGYHQHDRGAWRKRRNVNQQQAAVVKAEGHEALIEMVRRADAPSASAADRAPLQRLYDEIPQVWKHIGDLSENAQERLITRALTGYSQHEAVRRQVAAMRAELGYAAASQLEKLLIEQILLCWMRMHIQEIQHTLAMYGNGDVTTTKAEHQERLLVSVQGRYLRAIETLARVRRLLKLTVQINVAQPGSQQVNVAGDVQV